MEILCNCCKGIEDFCIKEIKELTGKNAKIKSKGRIYFKTKNLEDIVILNYNSRLLKRAMISLGEFKIKKTKSGLNEIYKKMLGLDYKNWIAKEQEFAVRTSRQGKHEFSSVDIGNPAGKAIIDNIKKQGKFKPNVNLNYPDVIFNVDVFDENCFVSLDTTGDIPLHKRRYKIQHHPAELKPTLAVAMIYLSKWEYNKLLVDPMCGSGTIPIEAGLIANNIPPGYFRKNKFAFLKLNPLKRINFEKLFKKYDKKIKDKKLNIIGFDKSIAYVSISKKNAISAGLKKIKFSRIGLEWLDTKFDKGEIDNIITNPPYGVKMGTYEDLIRVYRDLLNQGKHILSKKGNICLITPKQKLIEKNIKLYGYKIKHKRTISHGKINPTIYVLTK